MSNKRKHEEGNEVRKAKKNRHRKRSHSVPLRRDTSSGQKREAINRLFGRTVKMDFDNQNNYEPMYMGYDDTDDYGVENEDPLLDSIPVDMDPEQLGFLLCAQETLRFLHSRGIPIEHPVFAHLRLHLLRGIEEMGLA